MVKLQYGFLRLGYFVTGRYCTTIQDTANLAELAYRSRSVTLWDGMFWMSNGLCKTMDSGVFDRSRSFHPKRLSCLQVVFLVDVKPLGIQLTLTVLQSKEWLSEGQTATGTMARCTLTSHYTTM